MAAVRFALVGKDVASTLGYKDTVNSLKSHVDDEDKTTTLIQGTGSNYKSKAIVINESGLYSLILSSKLPGAKQFTRWVTSEVLPAIRKNGGYLAGQEEMSDSEIMAKALTTLPKRQLYRFAPNIHFYYTNSVAFRDGKSTLIWGIPNKLGKGAPFWRPLTERIVHSDPAIRRLRPKNQPVQK